MEMHLAGHHPPFWHAQSGKLQMKSRESGMPEEDIWEGFFENHRLKLSGLSSDDAKAILCELNYLNGVNRLVLDPAMLSISIAYCGSQHNIDQFMAAVRKYGVKTRNGW
jgi:hypothetical protein